MIEAEHAIDINSPIENVWDYVQDIRRWANLFPGCQDCEVIDEHDSRWTLKVGAGGLVKTVNVRVHVEQWAGPERVDFRYELVGEPVVGSGSYIASRKSDTETEVLLRVRVEGGGSMAQMWEAVSRPMLPQLARSFAGKLKKEIEETVEGGGAPPAAKPPRLSLFARMMQWLRKWFGSPRA